MMMRLVTLLLFAAFSANLSHASATRKKRETRTHEAFVPQVAFKCGFRSQYLNSAGEWVTDADPAAKCQEDNVDILAYCKRVYPGLDVTNFVEGTHTHLVENWCHEEGSPCKWQFWVKPYRCIVGEFESEALLVPNGCQFGHVDDRNKCEQFQHWNDTAHAECGKKTGGLIRVRSFSILEPCGLDKFSGVEYVCCPPKTLDSTALKEMHVSARLLHETTAAPEQAEVTEQPTFPPATFPTASAGYWDDDDDSDSEDDDDDDSWDDDDEESSDSDDDSDDVDEDDDYYSLEDDPNEIVPESPYDDKEKVAPFADEPYFREADPLREHERFMAAVRRQDQRHKAAISKVMKEWEALESKYQAMTEKDPSGAKRMRKQMTVTFQKQIATLEDRAREQRRQIDDTHQQRWRAVLNERKRETIKLYRDALTADAPVAHKVLKQLEAYIRAEEKDRTHSVNHYRHLLRSDPDMAASWRPDLLTRLEDIDYRINGTMDMLTEYPNMEAKVKPVALEFWVTYRRDSTPELVPDELVSIATIRNNDKMLEVFDKQADAFLKEDNEAFGADDSSRYEDERQGEDSLETAPEEEPSRALKDTHFVDRAAYTQQDLSSGLRSGSTLPVVLACGGALLLMVLVLTVVLIRRKHSAAGQGFMQVDACTPEEKHVAAMQITGYENPTYAHFEKP